MKKKPAQKKPRALYRTKPLRKKKTQSKVVACGDSAVLREDPAEYNPRSRGNGNSEDEEGFDDAA